MISVLHISAVLTALCLTGLWEGCALALMGSALCGLMPRASAARRHTFLVILFAATLALPLLAITRKSRETATHGLPVAAWVSLAVALAWLAAAGYRAVQLGLAWRHLCAVRRAATVLELPSGAVVRAGTRSALLCSSAEVDSPTILGFRSPRLLVPTWMADQLSSADLQQIALHECEHLRRGDDWINLALQVGLVLAPLNPALLWLNRTISQQRELAVDAAVVAHTGAPIAYATCLTRLAEQRLQHSRMRLALAAWEQRSELAQRVHTLLNQVPAWTRLQTAWASAGVAAVLLAALSGMAHVPQLVHVTEQPAQVAMDESVVGSGFIISPTGTGTLSGAHMVNTTFRVPTAAPVPPASFRKVRHASMKHLDHGKALLLRTASKRTAAAPSTTLRYATFTSTSHPRVAVTSFAATSVSPTPAVVYLPLVAVPVDNGWLLIKL